MEFTCLVLWHKWSLSWTNISKVILPIKAQLSINRVWKHQKDRSESDNQHIILLFIQVLLWFRSIWSALCFLKEENLILECGCCSHTIFGYYCSNRAIFGRLHTSTTWVKTKSKTSTFIWQITQCKNSMETMVVTNRVTSYLFNICEVWLVT